MGYVETKYYRQLNRNGETENFNGAINASKIFVLNKEVNWRQGVSNPQYRQALKNDTQAGTFLTASKVSVRSRPYYVENELHPKPGVEPNPLWVKYVRAWGHYSGYSIAPLSNVLALDEVVANRKALTQFVNKVRSTQTSVQGAIVAGEAVKTVRLLKSPVTALRKGLHGYVDRIRRFGNTRRSTSRSRSELQSAISETWLENSFGLQPLLNDIDDGVKTIADALYAGDPMKAVVTGYGEETSPVVGGWTLVSHGEPQLFARPVEKSIVRVRYLGSVRQGSYAVTNPQRTGFDLSNWGPTAWELLPYSFLADYFSNVGDIINAATLSSSSLRWIMKTTIKEIGTTYSNRKGTGDSDHDLYTIRYGYILPGSTSVYRRHVRREPYSGSLVPPLEFSIPTSASKWLNMTALFLAGRKAQKLFSR